MIQTGCKNTPSLNSYFCELHKNQDTYKNFKFRNSYLRIKLDLIKGNKKKFNVYIDS